MDASQLRQLGETRLTQIRRLIAEGELSAVGQLCEPMHNEFTGMQDFFLNWLAVFSAMIIDKDGDQALNTLWEKIVDRPPLNAAPPQTSGIGQVELISKLIENVRLLIKHINSEHAPADFRLDEDSPWEQLRHHSYQQLTITNSPKKTLQLVEQLHREQIWLHDILILWVTVFVSYLGEQYGDEGVAEAWQSALPPIADDADPTLGLNDEQRLELFVSMTRGHGETLQISEAKDHYDITMPRCGSGGKLIRSSAYSGDAALYKIKQASAISFNRSGFPCYCAHCSLVEHSAPKRDNGRASVELIAAQSPGYGACVCRVYKQDND